MDSEYFFSIYCATCVTLPIAASVEIPFAMGLYLQLVLLTIQYLGVRGRQPHLPVAISASSSNGLCPALEPDASVGASTKSYPPSELALDSG